MISNRSNELNRSISAGGLAEIAKLEGFRAQRYQDVAGIWTIGYGHVIQAGEQLQEVTPMQALALLKQDVCQAEQAINKLVTVPLTQNQFDALVSFVFNVGAGSFAGSTLLSLLNAGDYPGAADQFLRWDNAMVSGVLQVVPGLTMRREAERQLFLKEE